MSLSMPNSKPVQM